MTSTLSDSSIFDPVSDSEDGATRAYSSIFGDLSDISIETDSEDDATRAYRPFFGDPSNISLDTDSEHDATRPYRPIFGDLSNRFIARNMVDPYWHLGGSRHSSGKYRCRQNGE
jgi:hypothetical protein